MDIELSQQPSRHSQQSQQLHTYPPSESNTASINTPPPRKTQALVLLASFLTIFETIGINQTYGVFQEYYSSPENSILPASSQNNRAAIAFVGTLGAGLTWGGSIYCNPLMTRVKDVRWVTAAGSLLMGLGLVLAGSATKLSHLYATQGLLYGIGSSLLYFPIISSAPEWFDAHRGAAMGFILSGAGLGGLCYSPITRVLLSTVGARWTLRILGLTTLILTLPIAFSVRFRFGKPQRTRLDLQTAKRPAFFLQSMAALLQASGNFVPMTFLPSFSTTLGYSASFAAVLLAINNGVNTSSRILLGAAADYVGRQNMIILGMLGSAVSVWVLWLSAVTGQNQSIWIGFVVFYGVLAGGYNALLPTVLAEIYGIQYYAAVNGFTYFVRGVGALFGSPVGGVILDWVGGLEGYRRVVVYDGALLLVATVCVVLVRVFDAVEKKEWRWKA